MENLFVPYELAIKLKEKGFDNSVIAVFSETKDIILLESEIGQSYFGNKLVGCHVGGGRHLLSAPTYQQIVDWFREKYEILISIEPTFAPKYETKYSFMIHGANERSSSAHKDYINVTTENHTFNRISTDKHPKWKTLPSLMGSYYEALDIAIAEALKLI